MKSLYESILDDEDVLIQDAIVSSNKRPIEMWCEKHNIFDSKFIVNDNYEIERTDKNNHFCVLYLDFYDYTELPEYIKFADDEDLIVKLGIQKNDKHGYKIGKIESFRGIPNKIYDLTINTNLTHLPDLEVSCPKVTFNVPYVKKYGKIIIHDNKDYIRFNNTVYGLTEIPKGIRAEGTKALILTNCADFGDNFSKLLNRKAPMNRYNYKSDPVTDEGIENVKKFLGKSIDINDLWEIQYTQNSKLVKFRNNWYRVRNL